MRGRSRARMKISGTLITTAAMSRARRVERFTELRSGYSGLEQIVQVDDAQGFVRFGIHDEK